MSTKMSPEEKVTACGLFNWRPKRLQGCATPKLYLALYVFIGVVQTMMFTYLSVVLSTVEKRFGLKSKEAAWVYSGNEISQIFFIFALPFVGRVKRRPLWMGLALILGALGAFMICLPHFFGDQSYEVRQKKSQEAFMKDTCLLNGTREDPCIEGKSAKDYSSLAVVFFGIFLMGIGISFYFSFGIPYVDDNSDRTDSPFRMGLILCSRTVGPSLGYLLGALCLSFYINPSDPPDFGISDPRWLGAWWIGFIVVGTFLLVSSPWMTLFPQQLPGMNAEANAVIEAHGKEPESPKEWMVELRDVTVRLLTNKLWMVNTFSTVFVLFGFIGLGTFMPKYLEYHFRQPASTVGGVGGLAKTIPSVIGMLVSGFYVGKRKPTAKSLAGYCAITGGIGVLATFSMIFMACPKLHVSGLSSEGGALPCNTDCQCSSVDYHPICSRDGETNFFSPCHAGCKLTNATQDKNGDKKKGGKKLFWDCSCVASHSARTQLPVATPWWEEAEDETARPLTSFEDNFAPITSAVEGYCPSDCRSILLGVFGLLFVISGIAASTRVPNLLISLRMIEARDKTASLTLQVSVFSLTVFLPSPIVMGAIVDSTCVQWAEKCGETTHCLVYDTDLMREYMFGVLTVCIFLGFLCDVGVWHMIGDLNIYHADEKDQDDGQMNKKALSMDSGIDSSALYPDAALSVELQTSKEVTL